jgi:hypothetical protein
VAIIGKALRIACKKGEEKTFGETTPRTSARRTLCDIARNEK